MHGALRACVETFSRSQVLLLSALDLPVTFGHTNLSLAVCVRAGLFALYKSAHLAVKFISFVPTSSVPRLCPCRPLHAWRWQFYGKVKPISTAGHMPLQDDSPLCRLSSSSRCVHKSAKFKAFLVIPFPTSGRSRDRRAWNGWWVGTRCSLSLCAAILYTKRFLGFPQSFSMKSFMVKADNRLRHSCRVFRTGRRKPNTPGSHLICTINFH